MVAVHLVTTLTLTRIYRATQDGMIFSATETGSSSISGSATDLTFPSETPGNRELKIWLKVTRPALLGGDAGFLHAYLATSWRTRSLLVECSTAAFATRERDDSGRWVS